MRMSFDDLKCLYIELITTIIPGPASWSYFAPIIILPIGLLVPPSILSHGQLCAIVLPLSVAATVHAWYVLGGNDVISTDSLYLTLFLYLFKDPRRDFRRVVRSGPGSTAGHDSKEPVTSRSDGSPKDERHAQSKSFALEAYPDTFSGRLFWAMMLPQSRPLHDWTIGEPGHDRRVMRPFEHPNRIGFAVDIFSRLLPVLTIFLPLSKQLAASDPYFIDPTWSIFGPSGPEHSGHGKTANFLREFMPAYMLRPLVMAMYAYSLLLVLFLPPMTFALLLNGLHLIPDKWSPHTWRPHFGPFSAIARYGVRGFWGRWWHQQMRHIVSEPGRWLAAKLELRDDGCQKAAKYMLICMSAFALSGITHSGMVPPRPRNTAVGVNELRLALASFFWVQPVGIAVELFVLEPTLRKLPLWTREPLRVLWTLVFMSLCCSYLVLPFGQLGYWDIVPSAFVSGLL